MKNSMYSAVLGLFICALKSTACVRKHSVRRKAQARVEKHKRASECRENKIEKLSGGVSRIAAVGRAKKGGKLCV